MKCLSRPTCMGTSSTSLPHPPGEAYRTISQPLPGTRRDGGQAGGAADAVRSSVRLCLTRAIPEPSRQAAVRRQSRGQERGRVLALTSSMVHLATVEAEMPATPGRSLQCCSQHTDSERSGWADRADRKRDWCMASAASAGGRGRGCRPMLRTQLLPEARSYPRPLGGPRPPSE